MISALVGHLVGDYLLQNDWMALGKKQSSFRCAVHCLIWTCCVTGAQYAAGEPWPLWAAAVLFITHFIQDRTKIINCYMEAVGQSKFAGPPMSPWSIIVVDNVWHVLTIWIIWLSVR